MKIPGLQPLVDSPVYMFIGFQLFTGFARLGRDAIKALINK